MRLGRVISALALMLWSVALPGHAAAVETTRSVFFAGGRYVGEPGKEVMAGAMYVERIAPARPSRPVPLVFFHGAAQTATNWMTTPDGRPGWAEYFAGQGYVVYLVDQPARGRSAFHPGIDGALRNFPAPTIETLFTASETRGSWPQAKLHTQWPGSGPSRGRMGDPVFDQFYATQVEYLASNAETQALVQAAGAALLDRIGPAILVTHSQAGAFGWLIADARPGLVKAIVALEPLGPPFEDAVLGSGKARPWGPTDIRLTYDPHVGEVSELKTAREDKPDGPDLVPCMLQAAPARQLPRLRGIPIVVLATEASYHAVYDHCTAKYLQQAGADVTFTRLADVGLKGNGHMMMLELNSLDIAGYVDGWLRKAVP